MYFICKFKYKLIKNVPISMFHEMAVIYLDLICVIHSVSKSKPVKTLISKQETYTDTSNCQHDFQPACIRTRIKHIQKIMVQVIYIYV